MPGGEQRIAAEVRQRTERLDERGLDQIVHIRPRADHPAHDAVNRADVGVEQVAERLRVAPPRPVDERGYFRRRWPRRVRHGPHTIHSGPSHPPG
jgi:hypothetical protein